MELIDNYSKNFEIQALRLFKKQACDNEVYREYLQLLNKDISSIQKLEDIPFMPIAFFKSRKIVTGKFKEETLFLSSGTTQEQHSKHYIKNLSAYETNTLNIFQYFYGDIKKYCFLGLLPHYLEKGNSSLLTMVKHFMNMSGQAEEHFYIHDFERLYNQLCNLKKIPKTIFLIGVSYALVDFSEQYSIDLSDAIVLETGGMKGRKEELSKHQLHNILKKNFGVQNIHSEYGMTELLSQAYSKKDGIFRCPPTMRILIRDPYDALEVKPYGRGAFNIIDIANKDSIAFIATDDYGVVHQHFDVEILGRLSEAEMRGCGQLYPQL